MSSLSAVVRPTRGSDSVLAARHALEAELGLSALASRLASLSTRLLRARAECAPFPSLRQRLSGAMTALSRATERAHAAASAFRSTSGAALDDLDDARDLLRDALAPAAAATLRASVARARGLAPVAREVALDFENCASAVDAALEDARNLQSEQMGRRTDAENAISAARDALIVARERRGIAAAAVDEAHRLYVEAEKREKAACQRANIIQAAQLAAVVGAAATTRSPRLAFLGATGVGAISAQVEAQMLRAREEKAVFLNQKMRARERQLDVAKYIEGLSAELRTSREVVQVDERDVRTLQDVVVELRQLSGGMLAVESFWSRLKAFCDLGDGTPVDEVVQAGVELAEKDQMALWESKRFCKRLGDAYAHWMALFNACDECMLGLDRTRKSLYEDVATSDEEGVRSIVE